MKKSDSPNEDIVVYEILDLYSLHKTIKTMAKKTASKKKAAPKKAAAKKKTSAKKAAPKKAAKKAAPKKAAKKTAKKAAPSKKAAKKKTARKPNAAFMKPLTPSSQLAEVIGNNPRPRTEIVKKIWDYIKKNGLQDKKNKRMINADSKLKTVFGKDQISMFDLAKVVSKHVK